MTQDQAVGGSSKDEAGRIRRDVAGSPAASAPPQIGIDTGPIAAHLHESGQRHLAAPPTGPVSTTVAWPDGPHTGGISTGGISTERVQADRLVGRPSGAARDLDPLAASLPEVLHPALGVPSLSSGRAADRRSGRASTRHGRQGAEGPERPPANRLLLAYLVVVLVVLATVSAGGAWLLLRSQRPGQAGASGSAPAALRTLLVGLTDGSSLVAAALVGTGDGVPSCVAVPASLLVDDAGGQVPLARAASGGVAVVGQALARTLDVPVDAGWLLTPSALTTLVDGGGGVLVDVDQELRSGTVLVAAGKGQRLTGAQAAAYVTVPRAGEGPQAVAQRFAGLLGQLVSALPAQIPDAAAQLGALGVGSTSTLPVDGLAALVAALGRRVADAGTLAVTALPVRSAAGGQAAAGVIADRAVARDLVRSKLGVKGSIGAAASSTGG